MANDLVLTEAPSLDSAEQRARELGDLVERARAGDAAAFEEIIRRHERRVLSMAVQMGLGREDAQDAGQEIFLRVFRYLAGFQAGKNFEVWLWKIAVNVVYDFLRRRRDRGEISWETLQEGTVETLSAESTIHLQVENADLCARLLRQMGSLSKQERMVFVLREMQDLDTGQVARAMGISTITVRRHAASARQKLRRLLQGILDRNS